ncbi:cyclic nucleotide-binding domain protein, partial [Vibrio parahaemolyticus V-223/04]
SPRRKTMPPLR